MKVWMNRTATVAVAAVIALGLLAPLALTQHDANHASDFRGVTTLTVDDAGTARTLALEPFLDPEGALVIGVRIADPSVMPRLTATTPTGEVVELMMRHGGSQRVMTYDLGASAPGVYRLEFELGAGRVVVPLGVYVDGGATLILAPLPSLGGGGQSVAYLYGIDADEVRLRRKMPGMTHSTDDEWPRMAREAFGGAYDDQFDPGPRAYRTPVRFAMVGEWRVEVMANDASYTFGVSVLDE